MDRKSEIIRNTGAVLIGLLLLVALYLTSLYSFLLFHSMVELFTIIVAAGVFVIAWNARGYLNNNHLLFVGITALFTSFLDLVHTLAYQGMGVFPGPTANLATQLWLAARYLQSISWLIAPFFLGRRLRPYLQFAIYSLITGLLIFSIFTWQIFPVAYEDGVGLTPFKSVSEYIISLFFLGSIGLLLWKRREFDPGVLRLLIASLVLRIGSELAFTSYISVYGAANMLGHMLRLVAFYILYKAIIETGLVKPFSIMLRDLKHSEDQLREYTARLQAKNEILARSEELLQKDAIILKTRNEELDAYAHTVAHDLKSPLAVIIAAADVINEVGDLTRKELKEFLLQIKSTAFEMDNIIDSLLLLAEVRTVDSPSEPVDMAEVVDRVRSRLAYMTKEHHGLLVTPDAWPTAIGYGPWIEEVWANYISNALKYGGSSPRVELGADLQPDGMIRFWTRDGGPGVPPESQAGLFMPFIQLRKARRSGHGLGLSIVLHIVEKLGGQVGMESEPGNGSLFYFTLPAAPACHESKEAEPLSAQIT